MSKLNKIKSSSSFRNRIDFITAATLYCWHLWISKAGEAMDKRLDHIIKLLVLALLPKRYIYRLYRSHDSIEEANDLMFRNLGCGQYIRIAKNMVRQTFGGYLALPMTVFACIICSLIGWDRVLNWKDGMVYFGMALIMMTLIVIGLYILIKVIDDPRGYISYFKEFEKQDDEWLRKWKIYTVLLFVGALLSVALSFGFGLLCIAIQKNYI